MKLDVMVISISSMSRNGSLEISCRSLLDVCLRLMAFLSLLTSQFKLTNNVFLEKSKWNIRKSEAAFSKAAQSSMAMVRWSYSDSERTLAKAESDNASRKRKMKKLLCRLSLKWWLTKSECWLSTQLFLPSLCWFHSRSMIITLQENASCVLDSSEILSDIWWLVLVSLSWLFLKVFLFQLPLLLLTQYTRCIWKRISSRSLNLVKQWEESAISAPIRLELWLMVTCAWRRFIWINMHTMLNLWQTMIHRPKNSFWKSSKTPQKQLLMKLKKVLLFKRVILLKSGLLSGFWNKLNLVLTITYKKLRSSLSRLRTAAVELLSSWTALTTFMSRDNLTQSFQIVQQFTNRTWLFNSTQRKSRRLCKPLKNIAALPSVVLSSLWNKSKTRMNFPTFKILP